MSLTKVNKNERKRLKTDIPFYTDTKSIESSLLHKKMCIETQPSEDIINQITGRRKTNKKYYRSC